VSDSLRPLWTVACQAPLSVGFFRQEYWSGLPFPSPGDLPDPGVEPQSLALAGEFFTTEPPGKLYPHPPTPNPHFGFLYWPVYSQPPSDNEERMVVADLLCV